MMTNKNRNVSSKPMLVSIIMPCRNEKTYIAGALESLLNQEDINGEFEVLVADGLSDDGTLAILRECEKKYPQIQVLINQRKTVPFALTLLLDEAKGDFIVRADAHCIYPTDYVITLINNLKETDADNVGGVWNTVPGASTINAEIIASCLCSKFGVGNSYRTKGGEKPIEVETVPFGAWRSNHFNKFGFFDESFPRGQDLEHNTRIKKMGGKILCLPWLKITYFARDTFVKLRKMSFQYGYWKNIVQLKHQTKTSLRQYFPPLLVLGTILSIPFGLLFSGLFFLFPISYCMITFAASLRQGWIDRKFLYTYRYMYGFFLMHYYYGFGYLRAIWDFNVCKKFGFDRITR